MSFLDSDRFHRAAREGHLDLLQEANRKELNSRDDDGMTPSMWASYYGHLDALRLIVGRGGDPDKCDYYGNTSLHCAAGNGHTDCVSFLVNFGVNLWALDNDFHTAKDVAVLNHKNDVLRLLDQSQSKHALVNKKLVQRLKEKSVFEAEKRVKNYRKLQSKAAKRAEKEEKAIEKQLKKATDTAFRKDSRFLYAPKFSDIVNANEKELGAIAKKPAGQRKKCVVFRPGDVISRDDDKPKILSVTVKNGEGRTLAKSDCVKPKDGKPCPEGQTRQQSVSASSCSDDADSDVLQTADSGIGDELGASDSNPPSVSSIFERPGFGTVTFRTHPAPTQGSSGKHRHQDSSSSEHDTLTKEPSSRPSAKRNFSRSHCMDDSIGSASSLARRHISWQDECDGDNDEADDDATDEEDDCDAGEPISMFLAAFGLSEYSPLFQTEKIDLESLALLSEEDLKTLGMPLGPRRKLEKALQCRINVLREPGIFVDSRV